jgi:antitoxin (DNA-binding transcriptional repressor) of toxin-antitoxin stability system
MSTLTVIEARATLPDLLKRVEAGEEVTITRHGKPVAVVVRPDAVRIRRADPALGEVERIAALLQRARETPLSDAPSIGARRAQKLVTAVTASRAEA